MNPEVSKLPPLPDPKGIRWKLKRCNSEAEWQPSRLAEFDPARCPSLIDHEYMFTADQMHAYARAALSADREGEAITDAMLLEWLGKQMRTSTTYMNGNVAFDPVAFAMRKHDLTGRTFREAVLNAIAASQKGEGSRD